MTFTEHIKKIYYFIQHYIKCELSSKERLYAPFMFASTLLIIFNFAFDGKIGANYAQEVFVAEVFITLLFSVQISFMRQFDLEAEDNVFESFRVYHSNPYHLFLGKYLVTLISSFFIVIPTVFLALFFHLSKIPDVSFGLSFFLIILLVLGGLSALGTLMSSLLQRLSSREVLYPLFFYPLSCPLFLVGLQSASMALEGKDVNYLSLVLLGLDFIYLVLGFLLFDEILN